MQLSTSLAQTLTNLNLPPYPTVTGLPQPITLRSLASFAGALAWAWLLLVGFTGWGRVTGKLFRGPRLPASVACSLGIATIVFLGGCLNLVHAIYPSVVFSLTAIGLLLYILLREERPEKYRWKDGWRQAPNAARVLLVVALVILAVRAAATVRIAEFDVNDDSAAYLAFPQQMLAMHCFSTGPFSDRHIISSVGGGYWLQVFVIAATSLPNIGMADRTLGLLLLFAAIWDVGIAFELSIGQIAIVEVLAYLVPQQTANLTFVILPTVLLLDLLWFVYRATPPETTDRWRYALLTGAGGGAAVALKSTFLPCVGAFCLFPYLVMNWRDKKKAFTLPLVAGLGAILVLALWMIGMQHAVGTYLYPILGRGLDYSSYGVFRTFSIAKTPRTIVKLFLQSIPLLGLGFLALAFGQNRRVYFGLSVMVGAAVGITAFNFAAGGDSIWRYCLPQFISAILVYSIAMTALSREVSGSRRKHFAMVMGILPLIGCLFYYDISGQNPQLFRQTIWESAHYVSGLRASLSSQSLSSPTLISQYRAAEAAIPADGPVLEDVGDPYLFNFKAHEIFVMDWPGAASPAPGWPFGKSAATLAQYLQRNSVRYVVYDPSYAHWFDLKSCQVMAMRQRYSTELYVLFWMSLLSQNQLEHLRNDYNSLYDDGKIVVIDLESPRQNAPASSPEWTLDTSKEQMCSEVLARYLANPLPQSPQ